MEMLMYGLGGTEVTYLYMAKDLAKPPRDEVSDILVEKGMLGCDLTITAAGRVALADIEARYRSLKGPA
jgi:hypothetical protein